MERRIGESEQVVHCPLQACIIDVSYAIKEGGRETYIALSKNMITPPIKKNPPGGAQLAQSDAPKHIMNPHTHHQSRMLHQSLQRMSISQSSSNKNLCCRNAFRRIRRGLEAEWGRGTYSGNLRATW
jgi:hypothetical protein